MSTKRPASTIEADLSRSLVLGLRWEYAKALQKAPELIRRRVSIRPNIMLADIGKLGIADPETWTIQLKSTFATTHRFDAVRDVFLHEVRAPLGLRPSGGASTKPATARSLARCASY